LTQTGGTRLALSTTMTNAAELLLLVTSSIALSMVLSRLALGQLLALVTQNRLPAEAVTRP
jgi:hypothetical protein